MANINCSKCGHSAFDHSDDYGDSGCDARGCSCSVGFEDAAAEVFDRLENEIKVIVETLQWYLNDDYTSVQMGILGSVEQRPAYSILKHYAPRAFKLCGSEKGYCVLGHTQIVDGHEKEVCPNCGKII